MALRRRRTPFMPGMSVSMTFSGRESSALATILSVCVSRMERKPVWKGTAFEPRLILPLSLSYDHRVIDGADAVRFTSRLAQLLGDLRLLLL